MTLQTNDGRLTVVAGESRSGKSASVIRDFKRRKIQRAVAWDPDGEWGKMPGWVQVHDLRDIAKALTKPGGAKVAFQPPMFYPRELFEDFCRVCFALGDFYARRGVPLGVVLEEVADVSNPGKATASLGAILRRGLKRYMFIYPVSQRWAEADKTALGNATDFILCSMSPEDAIYMAKKTGIPVEQLRELRKIETASKVVCQVVLFDKNARTVKRDDMTFTRKR